jgi:hypothetical protein
MVKNKILFLIISFCFSASYLLAQQVQTEFGKNRVQFNSDFREWLQYESPNFIAYWYGPSRNVGQVAVQLAEYDNIEIQTLLEYKLNTKIELIVYTDLTDAKQGNIGTEEVFSINGAENPMAGLDAALGKRFQPNTDISQVLSGRVNGNKIFVYFDGNHQHLRRQLREGLATVYLNAMLFGSNLQEMVQNAVSYSLPQWYKQGITAYASESWNTDLDNVLKDIILSPKFKGFKKLAADNPVLAGHSFWFFLSQTYGRQTLSNLLYLTRINRNVESGFAYILGGTMSKTFESWESFFKERYENDQFAKDLVKNEISVKYKGKVAITSAKLSPDGTKIAYVTNEAGRGRVFVQEINKNGTRQKIKKTGFYNILQSTEYDYAMIAWKPNGKEISVIFEKRDIRKLFTYHLDHKKGTTELLSPDFQRVYSMEYLSNSEIALSATTNGFSDIFIYKPISRTYQRVTNDFYDDLDVGVVKLKGEKGLLWVSNRPDTTANVGKLDTILPIRNFDVFYVNLEKKERGLVQVTNTPHLQERNPLGIDSTYFAFLTDENGIFNRKIAYLDTVFDHFQTTIIYKDGARQRFDNQPRLTAQDSLQIDTVWQIPIYRLVAFPHFQSNWGRNILFHSITTTGKCADLIFENKKFKIKQHQVDFQKDTEVLNTTFRQLQLLKQARKEKTLVKQEKKEETTTKIDTVKANPFADYFQSEFPNPPAKTFVAPTFKESKNLKNLYVETDNIKRDFHRFKGTRVIPYRLKFRKDEVNLLKFDNNPIINQGEFLLGGYGTPPLGLLSRMLFKELLEDYNIEVGARFSLLINGQFNVLNNNNGLSPTSPTNTSQSPPSYNSTEYYIRFHDKKRRYDKKYTFYHRANNYTDVKISTDVVKSRLISDIGQFEMSIPFDIYHSLRLSGMLRLDKFSFLATDSTSLRAPVRYEQRFGLKAEYVYDNILMLSNNAPVGTRMKLYAEGIKGMRIQLVGENRAFDLKNGYMAQLGFDARHYRRIDKRSIIALRLTGATSFGTEKILYMIGGVEGAIRPPLGGNLAIPNGNYVFLMQAAQMRGFYNNIRNGNSMLLFNSELRVPVIQYLFPNVKAAWLKNFQGVGFFDVGTAWQGRKLFSLENPLNTVVLPSGPITVKVNYFRDPIVMGTGFGLRTMFLGYFVKFDYAWGVETRDFQKPIRHFSIGYDF